MIVATPLPASALAPAAHGRASRQHRPYWPDVPTTVDADAMHPRAVEMAEAMREGVCTFRDLIGRGFTGSEITEHLPDAKALAASLSVRQALPGADLPAEMLAKARAAIVGQQPMPVGAADTQALFLAWSRYCAARAAHVLDPWPSQRERCIALLRAYLKDAGLAPAVTDRIAREVERSIEGRH